MKQIYIDLGNLNVDYDLMKYKIQNVYKKKQNFTLNIETKNIQNISFYHVYDFGFFLKQLKQEPPYLKKTILKKEIQLIKKNNTIQFLNYFQSL